MTDGTAWFELGVKQQENEREQKAIQALQRAVELDPSHLPSYLALAVSYTNDSNRQGTYDAVREWVEQNDKYRSAVQQFRFQNPERADASSSERFGRLIQCLIAMARSDVGEAIDADIQIALAVLLNTNEVGFRSLCHKDSFLTSCDRSRITRRPRIVFGQPWLCDPMYVLMLGA